MANALFPSSTSTPDHSSSQTAHAILDEMILCGNRVAEARKAELSRIEGLFFQLAKRVEREGLRILTLSGRDAVEAASASQPHPHPQPGEDQERAGEASVEDGLVSTSAGEGPAGLSAEGSEQGAFDSLDLIGISSYEFLSIVDQIDNPGVPYGVFDGGSEWLAGEDVPESFS